MSLNSILAEILHKGYSFPSVKCTSFTQTITQLLIFTCPPKKSKTTSRDHATTTKSRVRQEKYTRWECPSLSSSFASGEKFHVCVFLSLCCPESESWVKGVLKEVKPNWIDLHQKRHRVSTGKERGKKQERQEKGQCESGRF